jgi:hypothetical protein
MAIRRRKPKPSRSPPYALISATRTTIWSKNKYVSAPVAENDSPAASSSSRGHGHKTHVLPFHGFGESPRHRGSRSCWTSRRAAQTARESGAPHAPRSTLCLEAHLPEFLNQTHFCDERNCSRNSATHSLCTCHPFPSAKVGSRRAFQASS